MLQTLIQVGKQLSQGRGEWDDIIDKPNLTKEREKKLRLLTATMLFNLDEGQIILDEHSIMEYRESDPYTYKSIRIQGGNNKAIYTSVFAPKSLEQFRKTFFGIVDKDGNSPKTGQFTLAIDKDFSQLSDSILGKALIEIAMLREVFETKFINSSENETNTFLYKTPKNASESTISLYKTLNLDSQKDALVLLSATIQSQALGIASPTLISQLDGYEDFLRLKFLNSNNNKIDNDKLKIQKLCYATGKFQDDVGEVSFNTRYNINKMFVTTTRNFASNFSKDGFNNNYQVGSEVLKDLERGSEYVLKHHVIQIAGINHCIIPQVFSRNKIDQSSLLATINRRSELLFTAGSYEDLKNEIGDQDTSIYWIDFLGFESDGNFFKTINYIKDVSKTHFSRLLNTFIAIHWELKKVAGMNWQQVMSRGKDSAPFLLNFQTLYSIIPLRKDKEKKNEALVLFKSILEQRKVDPKKLFEHYVELVLCHRYHRYKSYNNIFAPETIKDKTTHFDYAIQKATFQYLAIFQVLKRLNLLKNMEEIVNTEPAIQEEEELSYEQKVDKFLNRMNYTEAQTGLFYLGKALNGIAQAQVKAKHANKPILEKVNYNGMDVKSILKLYKELREKVKQYTKHNTLINVEPNLRRFDARFQPDGWEMNADEALFYIFSGYSFYIPSEKKTENN